MARCKFCGRLIVWMQLRNGKKLCYDPQPVILEKTPNEFFVVGDHGYLLTADKAKKSVEDFPRNKDVVWYISHRGTCSNFPDHYSSASNTQRRDQWPHEVAAKEAMETDEKSLERPAYEVVVEDDEVPF